MKEKESAVVFGASLKGAEAFEIFKDEYNIIAFSDNDNRKWGAALCGVNVISPEDIRAFDAVIIVASMYWDEISAQLYGMGFRKIFIYYSEHNEKTSVKHKLVPMCDLGSLSALHVDEGAADFELFDDEPVEAVNQEIIYREKNVLFFAYFFPPIGSSGVQRSLKFVKYLRELGWNPIVVSCGEFSLNYSHDETLLSEIPDDITVIRIDDRTTIVDELTGDEMQQAISILSGAVEDYGALNEFIEKIKENNGSKRKSFFYPQNVTMWILDVLRAIPQLIDFSKIHAVYVSSGPYLSSLIGYYLKNKYKKPWIMDFRDPWTRGIELVKAPAWLTGLELAIEKNMLKNADRIIAISPVCADDYKNIFGVPEERISLILNGYDEEDFAGVDTASGGPEDKLKIVFNGVLIEARNSPISFINAVNEAISEGLISKDDIEIEFVGERKPKTIEDRINAVNTHNVVALKPYIEHSESLRNLSAANVLLLIVLDKKGALYMYPGKLFEYLRMNRRILALVPKGSAVEGVLNETGAGVYIHPDDKDGIKKYLKDTLDEIRSGKAFEPNREAVLGYERKKGGEALAAILDELWRETQ